MEQTGLLWTSSDYRRPRNFKHLHDDSFYWRQSEYNDSFMQPLVENYQQNQYQRPQTVGQKTTKRVVFPINPRAFQNPNQNSFTVEREYQQDPQQYFHTQNHEDRRPYKNNNNNYRSPPSSNNTRNPQYSQNYNQELDECQYYRPNDFNYYQGTPPSSNQKRNLHYSYVDYPFETIERPQYQSHQQHYHQQQQQHKNSKGQQQHVGVQHEYYPEEDSRHHYHYQQQQQTQKKQNNKKGSKNNSHRTYEQVHTKQNQQQQQQYVKDYDKMIKHCKNLQSQLDLAKTLNVNLQHELEKNKRVVSDQQKYQKGRVSLNNYMNERNTELNKETAFELGNKIRQYLRNENGGTSISQWANEKVRMEEYLGDVRVNSRKAYLPKKTRP